MKTSKTVKNIRNSMITGLAVCTVAGAVAMMNTKKAKAKRIARKAGKRLEFFGEMLQSVADMTR